MNRLAPYRKTVIAVLGSVVGYLAYAYSGEDWTGPLVALATALGVYRVPNGV